MRIFATFVFVAAACSGAENRDNNQAQLPVIDKERVTFDKSGQATDNTTGKLVTALVVYPSLINGKTERTYEYRNGLRDGYQRVYNLEGKEIFRGGWKLGKTDGLQTEFYPDGQKLREYPFSDGHMNGEYAEWYPNGGKKVLGQYRESKKIGVWSHYNKEGTVDEVLNFQNGMLVSEIISFEEIEELHAVARTRREKAKKDRDAAESGH